MAPTTLMSANENSFDWRHGTITKHSPLAQYLSVLMSVHKCSLVLLSATSDSEAATMYKLKGKSLNMRTIANYCSLPLFSFGQALGKLQGKVVTHF